MPIDTIVRLTRQEIETIDNAIEYVMTNFVQKISPDDLARLFHLPAKKLQAGFQRRTSYSIHNYLVFVRLEKAKEFLAEGKALKQITKAIGYRSVSQFVQLFKKHTGMTPVEYRYTLDK